MATKKVEKLNFVVGINKEEHAQQFEEIFMYGTEITYKTLRWKLSEKAKEKVDIANTDFKFNTKRIIPISEQQMCRKINHPSFPEKTAYAYVLANLALIFV